MEAARFGEITKRRGEGALSLTPSRNLLDSRKLEQSRTSLKQAAA